jgi:hypothetical protein
MRRILRRRRKVLNRLRIVVPVTIDVNAEVAIELEEMRMFLCQNCLVLIGMLGTDTGPGESVVLPRWIRSASDALIMPLCLGSDGQHPPAG